MEDNQEQRSSVKSLSEMMRNITMIGQLGLSLIMPILMCLFACYFLTSRLNVGNWVYIPGFILGIGSSFMTAYKVYLSITQKETSKKRKADKYAFNRHR